VKEHAEFHRVIADGIRNGKSLGLIATSSSMLHYLDGLITEIPLNKQSRTDDASG
jgi:hypothetical protein